MVYLGRYYPWTQKEDPKWNANALDGLCLVCLPLVTYILIPG